MARPSLPRGWYPMGKEPEEPFAKLTAPRLCLFAYHWPVAMAPTQKGMAWSNKRPLTWTCAPDSSQSLIAVRARLWTPWAATFGEPQRARTPIELWGSLGASLLRRSVGSLLSHPKAAPASRRPTTPPRGSTCRTDYAAQQVRNVNVPHKTADTEAHRV